MEWIVIGCLAKLFTVNFLVINRNYVPFNKRNSTVSLVRVYLGSNNNRSSRKITGKKFQPLMQQDVAEESSDVTDGSYTCSPSKQGPLRLKLSSTSYLTSALSVLLPTHNSN